MTAEGEAPQVVDDEAPFLSAAKDIVVGVLMEMLIWKEARSASADLVSQRR